MNPALGLVALLLSSSLVADLAAQEIKPKAEPAGQPPRDPATKPGAARVVTHRVMLQGNDRLVVLDHDGEVEWEMPWGGIHDLWQLPDGHVMLQQGRAKIVEIDPWTKEVVWSYDSATQNGNDSKRVEVHAFQPLTHDGVVNRVMIAESGPARIIEVDRAGKLLKSIALHVEHPDAHHDTRLARKLASGNYLVCHERDGCVREYDGETGDVVWHYAVPLFDKERKGGHGPEAFGNQCFAALRLASGNTLITTGNGHSVLEVTPKKAIVWQLHQDDLPDIRLAWVTTIQLTASGHYVIGNCHAGKGQPLLVEIDPSTKSVVWTLGRFDDFGNSVSNSLLLDQGRRE